MTVRGGKIQDEAPLARLTLLGDNPKRATLETRNRRSCKRTGNPIFGNFKGQVGVDDRRMFRSSQHVTPCGDQGNRFRDKTGAKTFTNTVHDIDHARTIWVPTQFLLEFLEVEGGDPSDDRQSRR